MSNLEEVWALKVLCIRKKNRQLFVSSLVNHWSGLQVLSLMKTLNPTHFLQYLLLPWAQIKSFMKSCTFHNLGQHKFFKIFCILFFMWSPTYVVYQITSFLKWILHDLLSNKLGSILSITLMRFCSPKGQCQNKH
jgi:hypothetical protein